MEKLKELVKDGNNQGTVERVKKLLEEGKDPEDILKKGLILAMDEVGNLFQAGDYYIPDLLVAARAMKQGVEVLKPLLVQSGMEAVGKIVMGTVKGDMHDIGKNLVTMMFEGAGFEVIDLGVDIQPERFVEAIKEHEPIAVGLSALLTSTMLEMKNVIEALKEAGLRDTIKVLIGGAPLTEKYAEEIGADYFGSDPTSAKNFVLKLLQ